VGGQIQDEIAALIDEILHDDDDFLAEISGMKSFSNSASLET
jgi:hypothetical protein